MPVRPSARPTRRMLRRALAAHQVAVRDHQWLVERLQRHAPTWVRYAGALTARGLLLHARGLQFQAQVLEEHKQDAPC
jgi:hypothetical protein